MLEKSVEIFQTVKNNWLGTEPSFKYSTLLFFSPILQNKGHWPISPYWNKPFLLTPGVPCFTEIAQVRQYSIYLCLHVRGKMAQVQRGEGGSKMNIAIDPLILCGH